MTSEKPTREEIILKWQIRHDGILLCRVRLQAMVEVLQDLKSFGYTKSSILEVQRSILFTAFPRPFSKVKAKWMLAVNRDFHKALTLVFPFPQTTPIKEQT